MLNFEYRVIPSTNGEEGGDEIYLGTPTNDNGALLWESPNGDGTVDPADYCRAVETFTDDRGRRYAFVALNVVSEEPDLKFVIDDRRIDFDSSTSKDTTVTAWYVPIGDGPPGPPTVSCYGLDRKVNRFFRRSPIAAVAPTVAWAGGDDRVVRTSDSAVAITATGQMNGYVVDKTMVRIEHGADFAMWRMRSLTATGPLEREALLRQADRFGHGTLPRSCLESRRHTPCAVLRPNHGTRSVPSILHQAVNSSDW